MSLATVHKGSAAVGEAKGLYPPHCDLSPPTAEVVMPPGLYTAPVTYAQAGLYWTCYQAPQNTWRFQSSQAATVQAVGMWGCGGC